MKHEDKLSYAIGGVATKTTANKYAGNMNQTGNPDALINKGQGPRLGGTAMPSVGKEMFMGSAHPQKRQAVGDGQTTAMPKLGKERFDFARGPTKGNQQ
jgi:hypothetical protein